MAKNKPEKNRKRVLVLLLCIVLIIGVAVGGTLAYLQTNSGSVQNLFAAGYVRSSVDEAGRVTNNGNTDAYVRAYVVVNWMNADGNVYAIKPDYTLAANTGWTFDGEFFYYNYSLAPGDTTATAPASVFWSGAAPSDAYTISIEYVAEAIQSKGMGDDVDSAQKAWAAAVSRPVA